MRMGLDVAALPLGQPYLRGADEIPSTSTACRLLLARLQLSQGWPCPWRKA